MTNTDFRGNVQTQLYTLFAEPGAKKKKEILSMMYYNFKTIGSTLTEVWHPYLCDVLHNYVDTEWALNPNWFGYILY